jgi:hypothetical protein
VKVNYNKGTMPTEGTEQFESNNTISLNF